MNTKSLKQHPITTTTSRLTSIIMFYTSVVKSVKVIPRYLNNVWTSLIGFLTVLVQPMWLYFLSTPFTSSTSSSEKESPYPRSTTHSCDYTRSVRTANLKKNTQTLQKSVIRYISPDLTVSVPMVPPSVNWSTGPTTSSNQKPRKRGQVQVNSSPATIVSSAGRKRNAVPAAILTRSSQSKTSENQPSSTKKKSAKSLSKRKT